ncbi:MAG: phage baseplate protein [Pyrinomonadaceae bacterium]
MRALSTRELLDVWELGLTHAPERWALLLLEAACPDSAPEELARLSVGQRDARLLRLREWAFGGGFTSLAACPACAEQLELSFEAADVTAGPPTGAGPFRLSVGEHELEFRLPDSRDLLAVSVCADVPDARQQLFERCLSLARRGGTEVSAGALPPEVLEAVSEEMDRLDPQGNVRLSVACPRCGHGWQALFDICSYLRSELDSWARRLLWEVHLLASAYGWRESDTLALSPRRRRLYVQMVNG